ncbi:hypothetical protein NDU88_008371, partial [Pleurodeles waltl]
CPMGVAMHTLQCLQMFPCTGFYVPVGFSMHTLQCLQIVSCTGFQVPCDVCYSNPPVPADVLVHRLSGARWGLLCTLS